MRASAKGATSGVVVHDEGGHLIEFGACVSGRGGDGVGGVGRGCARMMCVCVCVGVGVCVCMCVFAGFCMYVSGVCVRVYGRVD